MKKRIWCALLVVLLIFQLAVPQAGAAESVYFVATEEKVLPLTEESMPFLFKGELYVPCSTFANSNWSSVGLSIAYNATRSTVVVYNTTGGKRAALAFAPDKTYTEDVDGNKLYPAAVQRNGQIFVPAALTARYFGLTCSTIEVPHGYLIWLHTPSFGLTDQQFANAATYNMENYYAVYEKEKAAASSNQETPSQGVISDNKQIFLCLKAGEDTEAQLNVLDRQGARAAFFCTPDFLEQQGDLLRRMSATGQTIGILADAANGEETVAEQLQRGNEALYRATCGKTRMVYLVNDDGSETMAAERNGYLCLQADLNRTGYQLGSTANANVLLQRISTRRGNVSVWLGETASASGLREFARAAKAAGCDCQALRETK